MRNWSPGSEGSAWAKPLSLRGLQRAGQEGREKPRLEQIGFLSPSWLEAIMARKEVLFLSPFRREGTKAPGKGSAQASCVSKSVPEPGLSRSQMRPGKLLTLFTPNAVPLLRKQCPLQPGPLLFLSAGSQEGPLAPWAPSLGKGAGDTQARAICSGSKSWLGQPLSG